MRRISTASPRARPARAPVAGRRAVEVAVRGAGVALPLPAAVARRAALTALRAQGAGMPRRRVTGLSITFLTRPAIRRLNREWLRHDWATDVVSFPLEAPGGAVSGDVYICPAVAREEALARGIPVREELIRLIVHGVLHVLGFEHPEGEGRLRSPMWRRQERLVRSLA